MEQSFPFDAAALKKWFVKMRRDLPWRRMPTPYAVWISEIMLQQTQVAVVKDYFARWMEKFPTIHALALASQQEVIKAWEGLGYYSRARHLHEAAQFLVKNYGGVLPCTKEELEKIKGIGPYTQGAILSFAFQKRAAAVDGNAVRVLTRYFAFDEDVQKPSSLKQIWKMAESILPMEEPWLVVEGLIELGAMVCKRDPVCEKCPLRKTCTAFALGEQEAFPKKEKKQQITHLVRDVFVIEHAHEVLVKKGEKGKVMADLYEFPYVERPNHQNLGSKVSFAIPSFPFSFPIEKVCPLPQVSHTFTRYKVTLHPVLMRALEKEEVRGYEWIARDQLTKYPFSSGHRQILKRL